MPSAENKNQAQAHYQWLDFLRFFAALMVVLAHVRGFLYLDYGSLDAKSRNIFNAIFFAFTRLGHEAVVVFFVLSGYLVGGKAIERLANGSFQLRDYAIDRLARIWVPLVPALALSAVLGQPPESALTWIGNLLGLQGVIVPTFGGNGPLWSLAYEIWFYVLVYAIARQALQKSLDFLALLMLAVSALVFTKLELQYLACWLIGAMFYVRPHKLPVFLGLIIAGVLAIVAIIGTQMTGAGLMVASSGSPGLRATFEILLAIATGIGCSSLVLTRSSRIASLSTPMAAFSYTLYLTHYPLLLAFRDWGWQRTGVLDVRAYGIYAGVVAACLIIAWMLYWPFERNTVYIKSAVKRVFFRPNATVKS